MNSVLRTVLFVVLVLFVIGLLPTWGYSAHWGYFPSGGAGLLLLILLIAVLFSGNRKTT